MAKGNEDNILKFNILKELREIETKIVSHVDCEFHLLGDHVACLSSQSWMLTRHIKSKDSKYCELDWSAADKMTVANNASKAVQLNAGPKPSCKAPDTVFMSCAKGSYLNNNLECSSIETFPSGILDCPAGPFPLSSEEMKACSTYNGTYQVLDEQ